MGLAEWELEKLDKCVIDVPAIDVSATEMRGLMRGCKVDSLPEKLIRMLPGPVLHFAIATNPEVYLQGSDGGPPFSFNQSEAASERGGHTELDPTVAREMVSRFLAGLLTSAGIDFNKTFSVGQAKSLKDLVNEVLAGESMLGLLRDCLVVRVDVLCTSLDGRELKLVEDRQEFFYTREDPSSRQDWRIERVRRRPTDKAVWEKYSTTEEDEVAARRAITQELQIAGPFDLVRIGSKEFFEDPMDYPGVPTRIRATDFILYLRSEQYKPEGYVEITEDKKTIFLWDEVKNQ